MIITINTIYTINMIYKIFMLDKINIVCSIYIIYLYDLHNHRDLWSYTINNKI